MENKGTSTYSVHWCFDPLQQHWHFQKDATYATCGYCGRITHFKWNSFFKRLRNVFGLSK